MYSNLKLAFPNTYHVKTLMMGVQLKCKSIIKHCDLNQLTHTARQHIAHPPNEFVHGFHWRNPFWPTGPEKASSGRSTGYPNPSGTWEAQPYEPSPHQPPCCGKHRQQAYCSQQVHVPWIGYLRCIFKILAPIMSNISFRSDPYL